MKIEIDEHANHVAVCGVRDEHLRVIEEMLSLRMYPRGNVLTIEGDHDDMLIAQRVLREMVELAKDMVMLDTEKVRHIVRTHLAGGESDQQSPFRKRVALPKIGRNLQPKTPAQAQYMERIEERDITFAIGPAGTGKTYLAVGLGVAALMRERYERIILTRPVVEAGESLGFLPGDFEQKISPYMRPLYDALGQMMPYEMLRQYTAENRIEVAPLAYMRGRTLADAFIILDEAQNTTVAQMKMFLSRIGEYSKAVITGDVTQVDLPRNVRSGLSHAMKILSPIKEIGFHHFVKSDVVRHPLVQKILTAYEKNEGRENNPHAGAKGTRGSH